MVLVNTCESGRVCLEGKEDGNEVVALTRSREWRKAKATRGVWG